MTKRKKNPSKAGISAASVKGNAGPTVEEDWRRKSEQPK